MKLKHYSGYGTINAYKLKKETKNGITNLVVEVVGNHEQGLERDDIYTLKRWLIDRFDKTAKDVNPYKIDYNYISDYQTIDGRSVEACLYMFWYNVNDTTW